jgi:hypothetical protein
MTKRSAARRAADYFEGFSLDRRWCDELIAGLLREDRERVRMERAILAWWKDKGQTPPHKEDFPKFYNRLARIAQYLTRKGKR